MESWAGQRLTFESPCWAKACADTPPSLLLLGQGSPASMSTVPLACTASVLRGSGACVDGAGG